MSGGLLSALDRAPAERTLLQILQATTAAHPEASALDDGSGALSYRELMARVIATAARLHLAGVRRGDRVGIRMPSGTRELYISILAVIAAGAAYVPVDADDPQERADLVFGEAGVRGIITGTGEYAPSGAIEPAAASAALFEGRPPHPSTSSTPIIEPPRTIDERGVGPVRRGLERDHEFMFCSIFGESQCGVDSAADVTGFLLPSREKVAPRSGVG